MAFPFLLCVIVLQRATAATTTLTARLQNSDAIILLGIVIILYLFGGVSLIFAGPITVMVFIAIKKLYVRDSLGEKTSLPGESA